MRKRSAIADLLLNPSYAAQRATRNALKEHASYLSGKTLDIGCGTRPYEQFFAGATEYVGLEIDTPRNRAKTDADVFYDGETLPFPDDTFDAAIAVQVIPYIYDHDAFAKEVARVLKPGGRFLMVAPFFATEHPYLPDYFRYTFTGIETILERQGFTIVAHERLLLGAAIVFQVANSYLFTVAVKIRNLRLRNLLRAFTIGPSNLLSLTLPRILPKGNVYRDHIVVAEKR